jgi:transcriptional regulator with XRE-family HTH domain
MVQAQMEREVEVEVEVEVKVKVKDIYLVELNFEEHDDYEEEMTAEDFGYYLVSMRNTVGITQCDMAAVLDYNKNTYNAYEKGKRLPKDWQGIQYKLQDMAKTKAKKDRENGEEKFNNNVNSSIVEQIISLHSKGKNIIQIGTFLSVHEDTVASFLLKNGIEPLYYHNGWDVS